MWNKPKEVSNKVLHTKWSIVAKAQNAPLMKVSLLGPRLHTREKNSECHTADCYKNNNLKLILSTQNSLICKIYNEVRYSGKYQGEKKKAATWFSLICFHSQSSLITLPMIERKTIK